MSEEGNEKGSKAVIFVVNMLFFYMAVEGDLGRVFILATIVIAFEFLFEPNSSFGIFSFIFLHDNFPQLINFLLLIQGFVLKRFYFLF
jgi:hypothetical protein